MSKEQIEEMAKVIARRSTAFRNQGVAFMTTATKTAESLYNAGYRKQSEVVREIFEEIETCFVEPFGTSNITIILDKEYFIEVKKKYIGDNQRKEDEGK